MTIVAAVAFSSAVSAQQSVCQVTSESGTSLVSYDVPVRTVFTGEGVNVVNRRTKEVIDFIPVTGNNFRVRCMPAGPSSGSREDSDNSSRTRRTNSNTTKQQLLLLILQLQEEVHLLQILQMVAQTPTNRSSTRRGFPASAALDLP